MLDKLCVLAKSTCLSGFLLGGTSIGPVNLHSIFFLSKMSLLGFVHTFLYLLLFMQVGTIRLTEALSCASHELLRLELSNCGLTKLDFSQICTNLSRINILDLNIAGNSIKLEV